VRAARERAAAEREQRVADALRTLERIEAAEPKKTKPKPAPCCCGTRWRTTCST
jgi:hypothetical protein